MKVRLLLILVFAQFLSCQNIENASPSGISSFIRLYEKPGNFTAADVEILPDGYAIAGYTGSNQNAAVVLMITDFNGNILREITRPGSTAKTLHILKGNSGEVTGFIVSGDFIMLNPGVEPVANQEIVGSKLIKFSADGSFESEWILKDWETNASSVKIDYRSSAITQRDENLLVLLGSYRTTSSEPEKPFLLGFNKDLDSLWLNNFASIDRTYINGKTIFYNDSKLIWASAKLKQTGDFSDSFLSIPFTPPQTLTPVNDSPFKALSSQLLIASELQPMKSVAFGYGLVGTIANTNGELSNMIFVKINSNGDFNEGSELYFDGQTGLTEQLTSVVQDTGDALHATADGGFILAGTTLSTPTFGNGARDILLIKIDFQGNLEWKKVIGGSGDETVCAVRESGNGYLICGSSNLGALSSAFIIKTDKNGELKN